MPEEPKLPVPEHLAELVEVPTTTPTPEPNQNQSTTTPTPEPSQEVPEQKDLQQQILTALETQASHTELLEAELQQLREERASGRQYIASLEQRGTAAPQGNAPQSVDFNSMSQDEIVQYMNQVQSSNLSNMASQFGELLELVAPDADIFKNRDAMYGLMTGGQSPKQAAAILRGRAAEQKPPASTPPATAKDSEIEEEVNKRVQEALTQNRSSKAGISGKPARNDATAPALSVRELHKQLYKRWVTDGEEIPAKYTRGLSQ